MSSEEGIVYYYSNCCERCFSCCSNHRLTEEELVSLNRLRNKCRVVFELSTQKHMQKLQELFSIVWPSSPLPESSESAKWKEIGFQTNHPERDFRAGGYMSLLNLIYFTKNYSIEFSNIISSNDYPFAISAINVTYHLFFLFQLTKKEQRGIPNVRRAPPAVMKHFTQLYTQEKTTFHELYSICILKMNDAWLKKTNPDVMKFSECIDMAVHHAISIFRRPVASVEDLKRLGMSY